MTLYYGEACADIPNTTAQRKCRPGSPSLLIPDEAAPLLTAVPPWVQARGFIVQQNTLYPFNRQLKHNIAYFQ